MSLRMRFAALVISLAMLSCATMPPPATSEAAGSGGGVTSKRRAVTHPSSEAVALLDRIERDTFQWFWDTTNPANGLVPDRWPTESFSSIAAVGFGLTAYGIGAERGWVTREAAAERVLTTLRFFLDAPMGPQPSGVAGHRGFYYHFLDMESGARFEQVELSSIDTTLLLAGALFCQSYFDRDDATEQAIRGAAEELYRRAEWTFFLARPPLMSMGWKPEEGLLPYDYIGYNETMILYILAIASPTHPIPADAWRAYTNSYHWATFYGYEHLNFGPLFGHQYSHVWIDFRGIQDEYMRGKGIDYFENSRRATLSQRAYAIANPGGWRGYGENIWGLTACDGPLDATLTIDGRQRTFHTYFARAAAANEIRDDGTIAPTAAIASVAFTPEISIAAAAEMRRRFGEHVYRQYGFIDSFNETLNVAVPTHHGAVVPGVGWFNTDYLGIDQGPIVAMIENHRSGLVWETMKKNPHIARGLRLAGFTGGWLGE
jgi:hypothetical protein